MKRLFCFAFVFLCTVLFTACEQNLDTGLSEQDSGQTVPPRVSDILPETVAPSFSRGAWVATVFGIDFPSKPTADSTVLKRELDAIVNKASESGVDALFFQVRPCADAFYKSKFFPWSKYLTGKQGLAPSNNFDPLEYIIGKCHSKDIQLHAWINPFRVTVSEDDTLVNTNPAVIVPWITVNVGGKIYFNPGEPVARELIINGIREITENYKVDGIHFDDYFYPEGITNEDRFTFEGRWSGPDSIEDWRRSNVDKLIKAAKQTIQETAPHTVFGISPSGIWANKENNALGSDTRGFESYSDIYADSRGWVKNEFIDYIAPQIYWYIGQPYSDFISVLNWWHEVCKDTKVSLYAGLAGYKAADGTFVNGKQEITRQTALADKYTDGTIIFSLRDL